MRKISRKVPDGKMMHLGIEVSEGEVTNAEIRGDFFLQPSEKLQELEEKLEGLKADEEKADIVNELQKVEAELIGFSHEDIAKAFREAAGEEK